MRRGKALVGYGQQLKDDYRRFYGATVGFAGRGEMIPNEHTYCDIDPNVVDRWGIPVLRFHWKWTDAEYNQVKVVEHGPEDAENVLVLVPGTSAGGSAGAWPTRRCPA